MRAYLSFFSTSHSPRHQGLLFSILLAISYLAAFDVCPGATPSLPGLSVFHSINITGSGVYFDSYDSSDPTKSSNGLYNSAIYAGDRGDIASDGTSTDGSTVSIGSANIYGTLHTGLGCP